MRVRILMFVVSTAVVVGATMAEGSSLENLAIGTTILLLSAYTLYPYRFEQIAVSLMDSRRISDLNKRLILQPAERRRHAESADSPY